MIKTIQMGDKEVKFSTNFAWCFVFRSQFGKDPAQVIMPVAQKIAETEDSKDSEAGYLTVELLGFTGITEIAWSMARLADKTIPEPEEWVQEFGDDFDLIALVTDLIPDAVSSCLSTKKSKAPTPKRQAKKAP